MRGWARGSRLIRLKPERLNSNSAALIFSQSQQDLLIKILVLTGCQCRCTLQPTPRLYSEFNDLVPLMPSVSDRIWAGADRPNLSQVGETGQCWGGCCRLVLGIDTAACPMALRPREVYKASIASPF